MNRLIVFLFRNNELIFFLGIVLVFLLLIFKDPFSQRTLIPNFEPHPDTFNYIDPAINFVKGVGFNMSREDRKINLKVPPLYSFSLIPAFVINPDPRMSYYTNAILAFISLFLLWVILKKIFKNRIILYSLLILYITNYYIYWVPSIIMAENLTLTLYVASLFFLLSKISKINLILTSALAVGLYATKYSSIPITTIIIFLSLGRTFFSRFSFIQKIRLVLFFLAAVFLFYLALGIFEEVTKGRSIIGQYFEHLSSIYKSIPNTTTESGNTPSSSWFGIQYFNQNLPLYLKSLIGSPNRFLWDHNPLVPSFVGILGLVGVFLSFFFKKKRYVSFILLISLVSSSFFMSTFYTFDARYIYIAIPILIIGLGLFVEIIEDRIFAEGNRKIILKTLIFILICMYLFMNFTRIKSQISLNLKYAETPWYYIAVLKMNEYFTADKIIDSKKPILISALAPYLVDYYSNGNYILLPLSYEQEFRGQETREKVWGPNDYSDLPKLYKKYLNDGFNVYVSRSGLGNEAYTNRDFNNIVKEFDTQLVVLGCFDQCNIYSVKLKSNEK